MGKLLESPLSGAPCHVWPEKHAYTCVLPTLVLIGCKLQLPETIGIGTMVLNIITSLPNDFQVYQVRHMLLTSPLTVRACVLSMPEGKCTNNATASHILRAASGSPVLLHLSKFHKCMHTHTHCHHPLTSFLKDASSKLASVEQIMGMILLVPLCHGMRQRTPPPA